MSSFFSKLSDKASHALNASPLAGKIPHTGPGQPRPDSPDAANQPAANQAAAQGGQKSHAFEALTHQFRTFQQQYSSATTHAQRIITAEKGLVLDFDNVAREAKAQSKEVYTWGQTEPEDLKDVTDRIAYLNFVSGALAASLAQKLDAARGPFKALRDAETALQPRRTARAALEAQLAKVENDPKKGGDLREQIKRAELEDAQAEREILILKRKALKDSEQQKWAAIQEYAEKLLLLAQAAPPILAELPAYPPTPNSPYNGFHATGAVRAALQQALDQHKPGTTSFALPSAGADLSRSDTRSFGETHAQELSNINAPPVSTPHPEIQIAQPQSVQQPIPTHVPAATLAPSFPVPVPQPQAPVAAHAPHAANQSPPIDPSHLNQMPAPLPPPKVHSPPVASSPDESSSPTAAPAAVITPTIAETGIPVSAGEKGPGPAKGSLHDLKHASTQSGVLQSPPSAHPSAHNPSPPVVPVVAGGLYPSAEEEKKRLAAQYSTAGRLPESSSPLTGPPATSAGPAAGSSAAAQAKENESAEEEKKRLEREERERILRGDDNQPPRRDGEPDEDLPPYQEPGLQ